VYREQRDRRMRRRESQRVRRAPSELELRELGAVARRRRGALTLLGLVLLAATWLGLGPLVTEVLGGRRLVGGALAPSTTWSSWWAALTGDWVPGGLGAPGPTDPLLLALAPLAAATGGAAEPAVMLGAVLLAGLGAWFAAGAATRSLALRSWAALVWASAPALLLAQGQGRLGAVLAHLALPWVALGLARAVGVQRTDVVVSGLVDAEREEPEGGERAPEEPAAVPGEDGPAAAPEPEDERFRGSLGAAAGAGLALVLVTAGAPVLLPAALLVLLVLALLAPRGRGRVLLAAVPALVVHAPQIAAAVGTGGLEPALRVLAGDPGLPLGAQAAPVWQQLLGWPTPPGEGDSVLPALPWQAWAWASGGVLALVALAALLRGRQVARGVRLGWWTVAVGLAAAGLSARLPVAAGEDAVVHGWPGAGVSLVLAGLLLAALLGADGLRSRLSARTFGWRQPLAALLAVLAILGPLVQLGAWSLDVRAGRPGLLAADRLGTVGPLVPAVGRQAQQGPTASRVLVLSPEAPADGADAGVRWQLLRGDGPAITDRSVARAARELDPVPEAALAELVARTVAGSAGDVAPTLAEHGVALVLLPPGGPGRGLLEGRLDATAGLERVAANETGTVWRVAVPEGTVAWATLVDGDVVEPLPAQGLGLDVEIAPGSQGRVLVIAERAAPGWRARLDGRPLRALDGDWRVRFEVPAGGGRLVVEHAPAELAPRTWVQLGVLTLAVLLALPVRRRRGVVQ